MKRIPDRPNDSVKPYEDALKLAALYRRFEHALKRANHLKKGRRDAQADWTSFAEKLGNEFFEEVSDSGIASTLITDPPRKLMADLSW
jgi:hypothetical protein